MYYDQFLNVIDSSSIDTVYFDSQTKSLAVKFVNGNLAAYQNVPDAIFNGFKTSESAGKYYSNNIRGWYTGMKVGELQMRLPAPVNKIAAEAAETDTKIKFKIVAEVTGGVTMEVRADDIADALRVAEEQINKAFSGDVTVKFKGVNAV